MRKWILVENDEDKFIIWVKPASKYDTTYYTTEKQESLLQRIVRENDIKFEDGYRYFIKFMRKYNMSELINYLLEIKNSGYINNFEQVTIKIDN